MLADEISSALYNKVDSPIFLVTDFVETKLCRLWRYFLVNKKNNFFIIKGGY